VRDVRFQGSDKKDIFGKMTFYNDSSRRDESENFSGTRGNMECQKVCFQYAPSKVRNIFETLFTFSSLM